MRVMKKACRSEDRQFWAPGFIVYLCLLLPFCASVQATETTLMSGVAEDRWYAQESSEENLPKLPDSRTWDYAFYLDLGYNRNFNDPGNNLWRSKSSTFKVNKPQLNLAMGYASKEATAESRWGFEFGLQTGVDTEGLVPQPPPAANEPFSNADSLRYLHRANASYLFPVGKGFEVSAGLLNSFIGYESFLAIQNINYTRGYISDFVPYLLFGLQGSYPVSDTVELSGFVIGGWNYLANPNDVPSFGFQASWQISPRTTLTQNLYYGPDQAETGMDFWRFFSDTVIEWKNDSFVLALAFDTGTEKRADIAGNPRHHWTAAALWFGWHISEPWNLGFRPEIYWDQDGSGTGAQQTLKACTVTLEYTFSPGASNTVVAAVEYRYDRSTGPEGGFFKGDNNTLLPDQHQLIFSIMWTLGS
jgi:hypothetical protein